MPSKYIENLLDMCKMKTANFVGTTGSAAIKRIQNADSPFDKEEHSKYRTAVSKLLWLAFVRPDCSYAVKELSRNVKAPTQRQHKSILRGHGSIVALSRSSNSCPPIASTINSKSANFVDLFPMDLQHSHHLPTHPIKSQLYLDMLTE